MRVRTIRIGFWLKKQSKEINGMMLFSDVLLLQQLLLVPYFQALVTVVMLSLSLSLSFNVMCEREMPFSFSSQFNTPPGLFLVHLLLYPSLSSFLSSQGMLFPFSLLILSSLTSHLACQILAVKKARNNTNFGFQTPTTLSQPIFLMNLQAMDIHQGCVWVVVVAIIIMFSTFGGQIGKFSKKTFSLFLNPLFHTPTLQNMCCRKVPTSSNLSTTN